MTLPRARERRRTLLVAGSLVAAVLLGMVTALVRPWQPTSGCQPSPAHPQWSVARMWDEALLDAIRRALPNPPVHARNLFHVSVAMWDAWAAYDPVAEGYLVNENVSTRDRASARNEAISYAAFRVLEERFRKSVGASDSLLGSREVRPHRWIERGRRVLLPRLPAR
ncbi:MAG: hypothetical protein E6I62_01105 [Chloroflexi bacterium]|nr:MAG: hypothetical protein E6I62_01105 [Chloroflexota bacterium]